MRAHATTANFDFNRPVITEPSVLVTTTGTGVVAWLLDERFAVYPNPASERIFLRWTTGKTPSGEPSLLTADGRMLRSASLATGDGSIDLSGLSSGTYFICTRTTEGVAVQPFIHTLHQ